MALDAALHSICVTANDVVYGAFARPDQTMRVLAAVGNASVVRYYWSRFPSPPFAALPWVALATLTAYRKVPHAQGMSTLWSFLYGYLPRHTTFDHVLYWSLCLPLLLPVQEIRHAVYRRVSFDVFPWHPDMRNVAVAAHAVFALLGYLTRG